MSDQQPGKKILTVDDYLKEAGERMARFNSSTVALQARQLELAQNLSRMTEVLTQQRRQVEEGLQAIQQLQNDILFMQSMVNAFVMFNNGQGHPHDHAHPYTTPSAARPTEAQPTERTTASGEATLNAPADGTVLELPPARHDEPLQERTYPASEPLRLLAERERERSALDPIEEDRIRQQRFAIEQSLDGLRKLKELRSAPKGPTLAGQAGSQYTGEDSAESASGPKEMKGEPPKREAAEALFPYFTGPASIFKGFLSPELLAGAKGFAKPGYAGLKQYEDDIGDKLPEEVFKWPSGFYYKAQENQRQLFLNLGSFGVFLADTAREDIRPLFLMSIDNKVVWVQMHQMPAGALEDIRRRLVAHFLDLDQRQNA